VVIVGGGAATIGRLVGQPIILPTPIPPQNLFTQLGDTAIVLGSLLQELIIILSNDVDDVARSKELMDEVNKLNQHKKEVIDKGLNPELIDDIVNTIARKMKELLKIWK
jgi:hypothetical protein